MSLGTHRVEADGLPEVDIALDDRGRGQPFLLLHGGAGPASMQSLAALIGQRSARAVTPTHPGFNSTPRPEPLHDVGGLARLYASLLDDLALDDVTVIGNSIGGWIAAELALLRPPSVSGVVLIDAVGIEVAGHPVTDVSGMAPPDIMQLSFHDPAPFLRDPAAMSDGERAAMASSQAALATYAPTMSDPTLRERLGAIDIPVLVIWGESDGIVDADYGRAYADAIPSSRFKLLAQTGHMPQMETPEPLLDAIWNAGTDPDPGARSRDMNPLTHDGDPASSVVIVPSDGGELLQLGPVQMRMLEDGTTTSHRLGIGLIRVPPHTAGPPQHWHASHDEGFYVVAGTAHFVTGEVEHEAPAGTLVMVPPGARHTFANHGDEECLLLNTFTPDLYVQYFRDLAATFAADPTPSEDVLLELMGRYHTYPASS